MSDRDVYLNVTILSKTWYVYGFKAIAELAAWLDENGQVFDDGSAPQPEAPAVPDLPTPTTAGSP